jgi:outer membrane biosynthesis protein TonB
MKIRVCKCIILGLITAVLILLAGFIPLDTARAQGETLLAVIADVSHVPAGNQVFFRLEVTDGLDVNAFDVSVAYDEEKLELSSWEFGGYLSNLSLVYKEDEDPGVLRLAATQIATPAVSGDGVLLELVFTAKDTGTAIVEVTDVEFADQGGVLTSPDCEPGEVLVTNDPTYTATPTNTSTPTKTTDPASKGTQTPTRTKTPTKTRTPAPTKTRRSTSREEATLTATRTSTKTMTKEEGESTPQPGETDALEGAYPAQGVLTPTDTGTSGDRATKVIGMVQDVDSEKNDSSQVSGNRAGGDSRNGLLKNPQTGWLNTLLWGGLILGSLAIVVMIIILIKRRSNKTEDLLL